MCRPRGGGAAVFWRELCPSGAKSNLKLREAAFVVCFYCLIFSLSKLYYTAFKFSVKGKNNKKRTKKGILGQSPQNY